MGNVEIPSFLMEMSKQINEQDNRCTADPVWQVRCKRVRVTAEGFSDDYQIVDCEGDHNVVATTLNNKGDINQQIVDFLDCDPEDLPINFEKWVDDQGVYELSGEDKIEYFLDSFDVDSDLGDLNYGFEKYSVEEYEDVVKGAFLTEADANWFINRKQHDYPKLYTYVESMYYCPQMVELREWIMGISKVVK